jgi:hypothetical protein
MPKTKDVKNYDIIMKTRKRFTRPHTSQNKPKLITAEVATDTTTIIKILPHNIFKTSVVVGWLKIVVSLLYSPSNNSGAYNNGN